jgi:hypothetical protein
MVGTTNNGGDGFREGLKYRFSGRGSFGHAVVGDCWISMVLIYVLASAIYCGGHGGRLMFCWRFMCIHDDIWGGTL